MALIGSKSLHFGLAMKKGFPLSDKRSTVSLNFRCRSERRQLQSLGIVRLSFSG